MRKIFFLSMVLLLFFYSCKNKQTEKIAIKKNDDLKVFFIKKVNDGSIYKIFFRKIDSKYCTIDSIFISKTNQTLDLSKKDFFFYTQVIEAFSVDNHNDYNFDDCNDICILNNDFKNAKNSKTNFYYLFDKNKQKYIESIELESIGVFDICLKNKCLHSKIFHYENQFTIYEPFDYSDYNYAKLTKYKWVQDTLKTLEIVEEKKIKKGKYSINKKNLIDNTKKEYISKNSIIDNMNCE